jgi:CTP:molybdopterin cytidylyltransferase MocA
LPSGLILAGGDGSRFGPESKLVQELAGRPVLEHAVRAQCAVAAIERVVVVLGAYADVVLSRVDFGRAEPVICPDWEVGMSATMKFGLDALFPVERVVLTLGDSPTITPAVIERLLPAEPGTRAVYHGEPGHPVILGPEQIDRIRFVRGDVGARRLLGGSTIECSDLCSGADVDTPAELERLRATWTPEAY